MSQPIEIKIFEFGGGEWETEWVAAESLESAKEEYKSQNGLSDEELAECGGSELTEEEMIKHIVRCEDGEDEDMTFRASLDIALSDGTKFPFIFASTAY